MMMISAHSNSRWTSCPGALRRIDESLGKFPSSIQIEGDNCCLFLPMICISLILPVAHSALR